MINVNWLGRFLYEDITMIAIESNSIYDASGKSSEKSVVIRSLGPVSALF